MVIMDVHATLAVGDPFTIGAAFVGVHRLATFIQLY